MIQVIAMAAAGGALAGSLLAGYLMAEYKDATWNAATNQIKVEAAAVLAKETKRVDIIEGIAAEKVRGLEAQHVQEEKTQADLQRRNRDLARELGGLRDPGRRPSRTDTMPAVATGASCPEEPAASGLLSDEASDLLLSAAAEVDALAEYARVCYEWKETVKKMFEKEKE